MNAAAPLRVLLLAQSPQRRGAEIAAYQLGSALARAGCGVRRLYLYPHQGTTPLPLDDRSAVLGGDPGHLFERLPGLHPRLLERLRKAIRAFAPDVVQAHGGRTVKYAAAARRLDRTDGWVLVYRNIGDPRHWARGLRAAVYRWLVMPQVDGVVGVSEASLAAVRDRYGFRPADVQHIPRGVDPADIVPRRTGAEIRTELGTPPTAPALVFVGSLTPEKRVDRLLEWAAGARRSQPDLRVWLIGEGPLRRELERRTETLDLVGSVHFAGARERVGDYLAAADLLLLSSDTEGMPGAVIEGAAAGLPAVATAVGGVPECIEDGVTGVLVPREEVEAGASAIVALLADPDRRRAMGAAARQRAAERYHVEVVAGQHVGFYERVLCRRRAPGTS